MKKFFTVLFQATVFFFLFISCFWLLSKPPLGTGNPIAAKVSPSIIPVSKNNYSFYFVGASCIIFDEQKKYAQELANKLNAPVTVLNTGSFDEPRYFLRSVLKKINLSNKEVSNKCDNAFTQNLDNFRDILANDFSFYGNYSNVYKKLKSFWQYDIQAGQIPVFISFRDGGYLLKLLAKDKTLDIDFIDKIKLKIIASPVFVGDMGLNFEGYDVKLINETGDYMLCAQGYQYFDKDTKKISSSLEPRNQFIFDISKCIKESKKKNNLEFLEYLQKYEKEIILN